MKLAQRERERERERATDHRRVQKASPLPREVHLPDLCVCVRARSRAFVLWVPACRLESEKAFGCVGEEGRRESGD